MKEFLLENIKLITILIGTTSSFIVTLIHLIIKHCKNPTCEENCNVLEEEECAQSNKISVPINVNTDSHDDNGTYAPTFIFGNNNKVDNSKKISNSPHPIMVIFMVMMLLAMIICICLLFKSVSKDPPQPTQQPISTPYVNPTFIQRKSEAFNYQIDVPSHFLYEGAEEQDMEDDFNLTSPDKRANIVFVSRRVGNELPETFTKKYFMDTYSTTPIYNEGDLERDEWYAISAKSADGYFHYRKCIYTDGIARMYTFSFPTDQEDIYLKLFDYVSRLEHSFKQLYHN